MISEFQELSDKIDQLADMTMALRRENAELRRENAELIRRNVALGAETQAYQLRLVETSRRVSALLEKIPPDPAETTPQPQGEPQ